MALILLKSEHSNCKSVNTSVASSGSHISSSNIKFSIYKMTFVLIFEIDG